MSELGRPEKTSHTNAGNPSNGALPGSNAGGGDGVRDASTGVETSAASASPASSSAPRGATPYRGSPPPAVRRPPERSLTTRALYRWIAISIVLLAFFVLYFNHPYYRNQQFTPFKTAFKPALFLWLALGFFYVRATLKKFSEMRYTMRDSGLHFVLLAKASLRGRFWRIAKNHRVRTTILALFVKAFFTPLMTGFVVGHLNALSRAWLSRKHLPSMDYRVPSDAGIFTTLSMWWENVGARLGELIPTLNDLSSLVQPWTWTRADVTWGLGFSYDLIFAVDCGFALLGYASESRWLGNKTRSVEPTAFGWLVCISCYPPFNSVLGTYLPLERGSALITSETVLLVFRGAVVFFFAIYAAATVSFGFKFSNLTNRGIVTRGPYRFVRHPAYLCKCVAWWLEHLPTITLTKAFFLSLLCGWYALRAWTEERHLSKDPDYRAYKQKTPWVIFPRIY